MDNLTPKCDPDLPPAITPDMIEGQPVPPVIPEKRMADAQDFKQMNSELKLVLGRTQHSLYLAYRTLAKTERTAKNWELATHILAITSCCFLIWALLASK